MSHETKMLADGLAAVMETITELTARAEKAERDRDKLVRWMVEWGWSLVEVEMEYGNRFRAFAKGMPTVEALTAEAAIRLAAGLEESPQ